MARCIECKCDFNRASSKNKLKCEKCCILSLAKTVNDTKTLQSQLIKHQAKKLRK